MPLRVVRYALSLISVLAVLAVMLIMIVSNVSLDDGWRGFIPVVAGVLLAALMVTVGSSVLGHVYTTPLRVLAFIAIMMMGCWSASAHRDRIVIPSSLSSYVPRLSSIIHVPGYLVIGALSSMILAVSVLITAYMAFMAIGRAGENMVLIMGMVSIQVPLSSVLPLSSSTALLLTVLYMMGMRKSIDDGWNVPSGVIIMTAPFLIMMLDPMMVCVVIAVMVMGMLHSVVVRSWVPVVPTVLGGMSAIAGMVITRPSLPSWGISASMWGNPTYHVPSSSFTVLGFTVDLSVIMCSIAVSVWVMALLGSLAAFRRGAIMGNAPALALSLALVSGMDPFPYFIITGLYLSGVSMVLNWSERDRMLG